MLRPRTPSVLLGSSILLAIGIFTTGAIRTTNEEPKANYAESVAVILNKHCVECHRPGEVAPFSLMGYENAKKWAPMIASVTSSRRMPPWKAVHGFGEFADENRLSEEQMALLAAWDKAGAPRGDKDKEPAPPRFSSEWALGTPDMTAKPDRPFKLEAEGDDVYRNFIIKTDFKETKWVTAMDVKPGNPKVVHHVIAFLDTSGRSSQLEAKTNDGQPGYSTFGGVGFIPAGSLGGWAPGLRARFSPAGTAFELKPGTSIVLQVHYHKSGKPESDQTRVGLYFAKEKPEKAMQLGWLLNPFFRLPAGDKDHKVEQRVPINRDVTIYGAMPHMHYLGKSMKATVHLPDGTTKPLVYIDDWDFNWQISYLLKKPLKVPKGSTIHIEAHYDNSSGNPRNPNNPPKPVTWGEATTDEMFLLVTAYTWD